MKQSTRVVLSAAIAVVGMLALATPIHAQESGASSTQVPAGVGVLILLMGLAAIGFIGFAHIAQSRADREGDIEAEEE
jgi:hypothetical protein